MALKNVQPFNLLHCSVKMSNTLPQIQIVPHPRARRLKLRVQAQGIRLTVPPRCSQAQIHQFLQQSQTWMQQTWEKLQAAQNRSIASCPPRSIYICGWGDIDLIVTEQSVRYRFDAESRCLYLHQHQAQGALQAFIVAYAKSFLAKQLEIVSQKTGLSYSALKIRTAKTRWGSCTRQHGIMLNAYLVLCPIELIDYVIIHELAHTQHFNHSTQFWTLVGVHCPHYQMLRQQLKQFHLPQWLLDK